MHGQTVIFIVKLIFFSKPIYYYLNNDSFTNEINKKSLTVGKYRINQLSINKYTLICRKLINLDHLEITAGIIHLQVTD